MNPLDFIAACFTVYAATLLLASSQLAKPIRRMIRTLFAHGLPWRLARHLVQWDDLSRDRPVGDLKETEGAPILDDEADFDLREERFIKGYDMISCRMCVGVWMTILIAGWYCPLAFLPAIYGASYFLHTQERNQ